MKSRNKNVHCSSRFHRNNETPTLQQVRKNIGQLSAEQHRELSTRLETLIRSIGMNTSSLDLETKAFLNRVIVACAALCLRLVSGGGDGLEAYFKVTSELFSSLEGEKSRVE